MLIHIDILDALVIPLDALSSKAKSALRITRSCSNLIETLYLYNLSELPIAELIFVDCSSLSLRLHIIFLSTTASIGQFYLVAIVRRPIPLLMQTVQVPCHIGHATIRTDRPILAVTMTIAIGSLLSIMISSIVRINRISRRFGRTPRTQKVKKRFITKFMSSCNQVVSIFRLPAWNSTITTTEWMRFSGGLLALEEGEE